MYPNSIKQKEHLCFKTITPELKPQERQLTVRFYPTSSPSAHTPKKEQAGENAASCTTSLYM